MFYRAISLLCYFFVYRGYYKKYNISKNFRFNGYMIRIYGDGEVICLGGGYISFFSYLNVAKGTRLVVGDKVSIAHNVKIYTSTFDSEVLIKSGVKKSVVGNVVIGNNVLIGSNTFICPGVAIGDNVVIGANSVVTKNLASNSVYGGAPARLIKEINL